MNKIHKTVAVLLLTSLVVAYGATADAFPTMGNIWKERIETPAPDFLLKDLEGNEVRLSDYKDRVVLLDFTTTWCVYCRQLRPYLEKIHDRYAKKGLILLSIYIQESRKKVTAYTEKYKIPFTTLLDEDGSVSQLYGVRGVPTLILIDKRGLIRCRQCRSVDILLEEMF